MNIEQRTVGDVVVLSISGDIAMNGTGASLVADKVRSVLQEGHDRLVLDMGRVRYVDSAGLGELVQAFSAVRNRGGAMKLLNVTKRLNDLLVVTKLLTVFDCFEHESEALASLSRSGCPLRKVVYFQEDVVARTCSMKSGACPETVPWQRRVWDTSPDRG
jgi:anti-sigma B factor antagonist